MEKEIEKYYQNESKAIVDMLFNNKMFNDKFTRDDFQAIEDYIAYILQSNSDSTGKCTELLMRFKK